MNGIEQTGLVCCSSIDDYENNLIKKHEFTRPEKELDRINHIKITGAQTGNVFLAYRNVDEIDEIIANWKKDRSPIYNFTAEDQIQHTIWLINDEGIINRITELFKNKVACTYIADGHHRAASAAKVREGNKKSSGEGDYFLTTLFPSDQLRIMDYNRLIKDLNGLSPNEFIDKIQENFIIHKKSEPYSPEIPKSFGMYMDKQWFCLELKNDFENEMDPIESLDISILETKVLTPILGIKDQRTDTRIDFVGGIRGLKELEERVESGDMKVAFRPLARAVRM